MRPSETSRRYMGRVTGARGPKNHRSPVEQPQNDSQSGAERTIQAALTFANPRKMMLSSAENVSDSDGESIDASLLDAIEHPRIERWPLDPDMTRVICAFVPRRCAQCQIISRTFRDQREALRRGEARAAIAAAVPVQLAAAIEAVLWTTETRESYGRATRRIVFALRRNDQLRRRVLDGSLTPTALAALDEEALAPPAVAQRRADDRSRLAKRVGARPSTLPEVDAFECPRCGARRAYVANATHGGSVDRAHILARCLECGRGWAP
jgi:DNA-directed RNA polymerase subunit M/transcription elongation factor TFIIS